MSSVRSHRVRSHKSYSRNGYYSFFKYFSKRSMRMRHKKDYKNTPKEILKKWDEALSVTGKKTGFFSKLCSLFSHFTSWLLNRFHRKQKPLSYLG